MDVRKYHDRQQFWEQKKSVNYTEYIVTTEMHCISWFGKGFSYGSVFISWFSFELHHISYIFYAFMRILDQNCNINRPQGKVSHSVHNQPHPPSVTAHPCWLLVHLLRCSR